MVGASAAMSISGIPSKALSPVSRWAEGGCLYDKSDAADMEESDIDIVVVATRDAILMVEGEAHLVSGLI